MVYRENLSNLIIMTNSGCHESRSTGGNWSKVGREIASESWGKLELCLCQSSTLSILHRNSIRNMNTEVLCYLVQKDSSLLFLNYQKVKECCTWKCPTFTYLFIFYRIEGKCFFNPFRNRQKELSWQNSILVQLFIGFAMQLYGCKHQEAIHENQEIIRRNVHP